MTMPDAQPASPAREIRVFLSSTFKDMLEERNYLMSQVFPLVRQRCSERDVVFTEIDLRWGITEEAAQNGQTVELCLKEIERCRALRLAPFFIGFLGGRYGWIPTPGDLGAYWDAHADSPYAAPIRQALAQGISVTELEIRFGFLDALDAAAPCRVLMLMRDPALTRSITERLAASAPAPAALAQPSFGTRLRRLFVAAFAPADLPGSKVLADGFGEPLTSKNKLALLKEVMRDAHRDNAIALVDGYASVEAFGRAVHDFLMAQLDALFPVQQAPDAMMQVAAAHRAYAASRLRSYVDQRVLTDHMLGWLHAPASGPLAMLQGESGSGKSAFLADLAATLDKQPGKQQGKQPGAQSGQYGDSWVFPHFCGVDGYTELNHWRDRLLDALRAHGWGDASLSGQDGERWAALPVWLAQARRASGRSIVLLLDAVNQLADAATALDRLATIAWPEGVRLISSCTPALAVAPAWHGVTMPALDEAARRDFVTSYLGNFAKSISAPLLQALASAPACENRLFLKLVLEEARVHASHESLPGRVDELLQYADSGALFLACLEQLDGDFAGHATGLATAASRLLGASRRGLTHHELAQLLAAPGQARLPDAVLLPLLANLQPYLETHAGRLQLMHAILADALQAQHAEALAVRRQLIGYFSGDDPWALTERAYQLIRTEFADSTKLVQDMFIGELDGMDVQNLSREELLAHLFQQHEASNDRIVESSGDLRIFVQIWALDANIAVNALETIGAGKPWQSTDSQVALVDAWFASIAALTADALHSLQLARLGTWFVEQGFYFLAKLFLLRLLDMQRALMPADRTSSAVAATQLGKAHFMVDEFGDAERVLLQALADWQAAGMAHSGAAIATLTVLASTLRRLDQPQRALPLQQEALAIHMAPLDQFDREACAIAVVLALLYAECGDLDQARPLAESTLAAARRLLGPTHRELAPMLEVMAMICVQQQDVTAGEGYLREAVALLRLAAPAATGALANALVNLGTLREQFGAAEEVEAIYQEAWRHYQLLDATFDSNAPYVLSQLSTLASARGDTPAALSALEDLLGLCDTSPDAPYAHLLVAARALKEQAVLLTQGGTTAPALDGYRQAYALLQRMPQTEDTIALMAAVRDGMGQPAAAASFDVGWGSTYAVRSTVVRYHLPGTK